MVDFLANQDYTIVISNKKSSKSANSLLSGIEFFLLVPNQYEYTTKIPFFQVQIFIWVIPVFAYSHIENKIACTVEVVAIQAQLS